MGAGHRQVVAEDHALELQLAAQNILQPAPRESSRLAVDLRVDHMGRHHRGQLLAEQSEWLQIGGADLLQAAFIHRNRHMGVRLGPAVAWEVFAGGGHAGSRHAADKGAGQLRGTVRITVKRTCADHRTALVIQIQHRRKTQVQPDCQHFRGHQPTTVFGQLFSIGLSAIAAIAGKRTKP